MSRARQIQDKSFDLCDKNIIIVYGMIFIEPLQGNRKDRER